MDNPIHKSDNAGAIPEWDGFTVDGLKNMADVIHDLRINIVFADGETLSPEAEQHLLLATAALEAATGHMRIAHIRQMADRKAGL